MLQLMHYNRNPAVWWPKAAVPDFSCAGHESSLKKLTRMSHYSDSDSDHDITGHEIMMMMSQLHYDITSSESAAWGPGPARAWQPECSA